MTERDSPVEVISHRELIQQNKSLPLWWLALDTTFPHKVTMNIIISSFPFVAFCKYLLLILKMKKEKYEAHESITFPL